MSDYDPVFHVIDNDLFQGFIRALPRNDLADPLRRDGELRNRHFRGFQLSNSSPSRAQLAEAYRKEILERGNTNLLNFLCKLWLIVHSALTQMALTCFGLNPEKLSDFSWLSDVHRLLEETEWEPQIRKIVRRLSGTNPREEVLIFISIIAYVCRDQMELRQVVEEELTFAQTDPEALKESLQHQLGDAESSAKDIERKTVELELQIERNREKGNVGISAAESEAADLEHQIAKAEPEISHIREQLSSLDQRLEDLNKGLDSAKTKREKTLRTIERLRKSLQADEEDGNRKLNELRSERLHVDSAIQGFQEHLRLAEEKLRTKREEEEAEKARAAEELKSEQQKSAGPATLETESQTQMPTLRRGKAFQAGETPRGWLERMIEIITNGWFSSSCVTLELLRITMRAPTQLDEVAEPSLPILDDPISWETYLAQEATRENRWPRDVLAQYALARTVNRSNETTEELSDIVLSGLYHVGRTTDGALRDQLLQRIIEIWANIRPVPATEGELPASIVSVVENTANDSEALRQLGVIQAKLATANPSALLGLYDLLPGRSRVSAKRALVMHFSSRLAISEKDPTHEIVDLVCTTLNALAGAVSGTVRSWWGRSSLESIAAGRKPALSATGKMREFFSEESKHRVERFKELMGPQLTAVISNGTPDGYSSFVQSCIDLLEYEMRSPEWISSRFLFPLVLQVAQAGLSADTQVRKTLRAQLNVVLEKAQQPIGTVPREILLGIRLVNSGNCAAENVNAMFFPMRASDRNVVLKNAEVRLPKVLVEPSGYYHQIGLSVLAPSTAIELEYLLSWSDPSAPERETTGVLKVIAQKDISWDRAAINPYNLRSIERPDRLFGRQEVVERLRVGALAAQSFYLTGQKRVGKSSVSRVLCRGFAGSDQVVPVYITLGELNARSPASIMYSLSRAIVDQFSQEGRDVGQVLPTEPQFSAEMGAAAGSFIRALQQKFPERTFLCVIDDFDELDEVLYKGSESNALFLYFRTLIDRGMFSLVFVGSERLPEILRYQGEKLNQVQRVNLDYLTDMLSVSRLIASPASDVLEFSQEAVDSVWQLSAGNPYYATTLCKRVYDRMVRNRDHYVSPRDVDNSVEALIQEEGVSTFQHFWTDGLFSDGPEAERLAQFNALTLISCAQIESDCPTGPTQEQLLDHALLKKYEATELRYVIGRLVERKVFHAEADNLRLRVPLLSKWLRGPGAAAVRASFGERDFEMVMAPTRPAISDQMIVDIARDLVYQDAQVNETRIKAWLGQFGTIRNQLLVLPLLTRLKSEGYYSSAKIHSSFKTLHSVVVADQASSGRAQVVKRGKTANYFVTYMDSDGKSGGYLAYRYRTANDIPAALVGSPQQAIEFLRRSTTNTAIIFVDDFIGTGGTFLEGFSKFADQLRESGVASAENSFYLVTLIGLQAGIEAVKIGTESPVRVVVGSDLGARERAFSPASEIFSTDSDRVEAERLCRTIGEALEPKQPLGYGDSQALITFPHRCPNNTLPIFYKTGRQYQGREWQPLFPR
jgi:predicted  nucleic acid-binding Zn-ribbon protein